MQAQRQAKNQSGSEAELSTKINKGIPSDLKKHYDELMAKKEAATLTSYEYGELLGLTEQIKQLEAQYLENSV